MRARRRIMVIVVVAAIVAAAGIAGGFALQTRRSHVRALPEPRPATVRASGTVSVFPSPGTLAASPRTGISLRGVAPGALGAVEVTGSVSGPHAGTVVAHSDGEGASFTPRTAFTPGERVTVRTGLAVRGGDHGTFEFTVARPYDVPEDPTPPIAPDDAAVSARPSPSYASRPDLHPPAVDVVTHEPGTASGDVFVSPGTTDDTQDGPLILDDRGEPVWFHPLDHGRAYDFEVQQYRGAPVLTWFQGDVARGYGSGEDVIYDDTYHAVARVRAGNGYDADLHEFRITAQDTALVTIYSPVLADLSPIGGPKRAPVLDCVVQEIDIPTGAVLFEWHTLGNVSLKESYAPLPKDHAEPYDPVHVNSIDVDAAGNLLISGRHTFSVFDVDRVTGTLVWRMGGKHSNFEMGPGSQFAWQHDVRVQPDGTYTVFDNGASSDDHTHEQSRGLVLRVDEEKRRVRLVHAYRKPRGPVAESQGSFQRLPNGKFFAGWGNQPEYTEFAADGTVLSDVLLPAKASSYRAFRFAWTGHPTDLPRIAVTGSRDNASVRVSWNGATDVARWDVVAGATPATMRVVTSSPPDGFETAIALPVVTGAVAVRAVDASGRTLATSATTPVGG